MKRALGRLCLTAVILIVAGCSNGSGVIVGGGGTRILFVTDALNNRVLIYNDAFTTGESANVVLGQPIFTSAAPSLTATGLSFPGSVAVDDSGNAFVSDRSNNRVLEYKPNFTNGMAAALVLGQADFVTGTANTTQTGLKAPSGVAFDSSGNLWVADGFNNRVLQFMPPFANNMNANLVIGQSDFITGTSGLSNTKFNDPEHLAFDSSGNLWVTDAINSRVLEFKPPFANGMAATVVLGQPDFVTEACNPGASENALCNPFGVAFDSKGNLWVGDDLHCRVLQFMPPFSSNMAASLELGQAAGPNQFTDSCVATSPTQSGFFDALGLAFDSKGNLFVADFGENRTLIFSPPFSNGMNASLVLGQPDFTTCGTNTSCAPAPPTATSENGPEGVTPAP